MSRRSRRTAAARTAPRSNVVQLHKAASDVGSDLIQSTDQTILDAVSGSRSAGPTPSDLEQYWMLYTKHVWVSTCVDLIAEAVASEGFVVAPVNVKNSGGGNQNDDARIGEIEQFFAGATPGSTFESLRLATAIDLRVYNLAYWRKKRARGTSGPPLFLERIDPRLVRPKLTADRTAIESFSVNKSVSNNALGAREIIPRKDVIFFRFGGGDPIFGGPSPLEALDLTISQDWSIRRHREAFFRNGGVRGRVIQIESVDEDQARKMTDRLKKQKTGTEAAFQDLVLPGRGITVVSTGAEQGKNDFDFREGSEQLRNEIFAKYKVPPGKLFMQHGALGQAGKEQDDETFQRDAVLPVERVLYSTLTIDLLRGEFGIDDLKLEPKRISQIRLDRFDAAKNVVQFGGTGNEARAIAGLPSIEGLDQPLFVGAKQALTAVESPLVGDKGGDGDVPTVDDQAAESEAVRKADETFRRWRRAR
jgi:hypothetical protein